MFNKPLKSKILATTTFTYQGTDGPLKGVTITASHPISGIEDLADLKPSSNSKITDYDRKLQEILDGDTPITGSMELKFSDKKGLVLSVAGVKLGAEIKSLKLVSNDEGKPELHFKMKCAPVSSEVKMGTIHFLHSEEAVVRIDSTQSEMKFEDGVDVPGTIRKPKKGKKAKK